MFERKRKITVPSGHKECPTCGRVIKKTENHETVERVVRVNNHYGNAGPGEHVKVELLDAETTAVQLATMSLDEFDMLEKARKAPKPQKKGLLAEMVEKSMAATKSAVNASIERGKRRLAWEKKQADERAEAIKHGRDLPKQSAAPDAEPPSREHQEVER